MEKNGKTPQEMASPENTCTDVIDGTVNKRERIKKSNKNKTTSYYMNLFFLLSVRSIWPLWIDAFLHIGKILRCAAFDSIRKY